LRSERSLIQTIGRAARHLNGHALLYADRVTDSMRRAVGETERRRAKQLAHNQAQGITPKGVAKRIKELIDGVVSDKGRDAQQGVALPDLAGLSEKEASKRIQQLEKQMFEHARNLEFEQAARLRDQLVALKEQLFGAGGRDAV